MVLEGRNFMKKTMALMFAFVVGCGTDIVEPSSNQPYCSDIGCQQGSISCGDVGCVCDLEGGPTNKACNPIPACDELIEHNYCEMMVKDAVLGYTCRTSNRIYVACHE